MEAKREAREEEGELPGIGEGQTASEKVSVLPGVLELDRRRCGDE